MKDVHKNGKIGHGAIKDSSTRGLTLKRCLKVIDAGSPKDVLEVGRGAGSFAVSVKDPKPRSGYRM